MSGATRQLLGGLALMFLVAIIIIRGRTGVESMNFMFEEGARKHSRLLAALMVVMLWSCAPERPTLQTAASTDLRIFLGEPGRAEYVGARGPAEYVCAIYRSMFPASAIRPIDTLFGDPRISIRTEAGNVTPDEVRAIHEQVGPENVSEDLLARAFQNWRSERLPDCDWRGFAREVSAPARNGQIGPVLIRAETGSYTRVSKPYFIGRDFLGRQGAIVLVREAGNSWAPVTRELILASREDDGHWSIQTFPIEGQPM